MYPTDRFKIAYGLAPISKSGASYNGANLAIAVDTQGAKHAFWIFGLGVIGGDMTALKLTESNTLTDANTLASATDITGCDFSVSPAILPTTAAYAGKLVTVSVPITGARKRYQHVIATAGTTTLAFSVCLLSMRDEATTGITAHGVMQELTAAG